MQAGFGIEALVDVALALRHGEAKGRDGHAEGCIIMGEVGARLPLGRKAHADGAQPVMGLERGQRAHPLHIAMDVRVPQARWVGRVDRELMVAAEIPGGGRAPGRSDFA